MQEKNFENQVKELLYDHSESAPNVMSKVFEKRTPLYVFKNRLILNKYKLMAAALFIGLLAFLFNIKSDTTESTTPAVVNTEQPANLNANNGAKGSSGKGIVSTDVDLNQSSKVDNNVSPIGNETPQDNLNNPEKTVQNSDYNSTGNAKKMALEAYLREMKKKRNSTNQDETGNGDGGLRPDIGSQGTPNTNEGVARNSAEVVQNQIEDNSNLKGEEKNVVENVADVNNTNTNTDAANDAKTTITKTETSSSSSENNNTGGDEDFGLPKTKDGKWSVSANTIVGIGSRTLDHTGDNGTINVRKNSETQKLSFGAEMLVNYKISDNLDVYTGFSYFNRREAMSYQHTTQVTDMDIQSKQVVEHHPVFGTRQITVYDTTYSKRNVNTNGDYTNSYAHYFIPLGMRYTLYKTDRLGISFAMNGGVEVITQTKGTILNDQYQEVKLDQDFARTSLGGMVGVGVGLTGLVTNRISLIGELRTNLFLDPTNGPSYPINQLDQGYGLMIGLKYDL